MRTLSPWRLPPRLIWTGLVSAAIGLAISGGPGCTDASSAARGKGAAAGQAFTVVRVVDGDTIVLLGRDGREERIRVQGIDTPEVHASSKLDRDEARSMLDREAIRQLGRAASGHARELLREGADVHVSTDGRGRIERDRYGRLVGYVEAADAFGQPFDFGGRMIADGYAHAYSRAGIGSGGGRFPHERQDYYAALERQAREQGLGLWSPSHGGSSHGDSPSHGGSSHDPASSLHALSQEEAP